MGMGPEQWRRSVARTFNVWTDFDARARFLLPIDARKGCWLHPRMMAAPWGHRHNVHRLSYALFVGPLDQGQKVVSMCGKTQCCRPDHLMLQVKQPRKPRRFNAESVKL